MLFQITNTCNMGCPHCLQKSTRDAMHMSREVFEKAIDFARYSGSRVCLVSGGEPTLHPNYEEILERCCETFEEVVLVTNGEWLGVDNREEYIFSLLKCFPRFRVQITSTKEYYKDYALTENLARFFISRISQMGLSERVYFFNGHIELKSLGRAAEDKGLVEKTKFSQGTTSCFASVLVAAQTSYTKAIQILEDSGKFCHPLIDFKGSVHWSESWLCPGFGNVEKDKFEDIAKNACQWRPCGRCSDYNKLLHNHTYRYEVAKKILGIPN